MKEINSATALKNRNDNQFSKETTKYFEPYITSLSKFSKGMLEGLTTIVPLTMGLGFAVELISGINECGFAEIFDKNSVAPFAEAVIVGPIAEEWLFRKLFQRLVAKGLVTSYIAVKDMVSKEKTVLDKKTEKAARINIASVAFALTHLVNFEESIRGYVFCQIVVAFFAGRILGKISESELGIEGSSGAHVVNNLVSYIYDKYTCG